VAPSRHRIRPNGRFVLPMAVVVTLGLAVAGAHGIRLEALALAGAEAAAWGWMRLSARTLLLDDDGYAIEAHGRERFRVRWAEVTHVRHDPGEQAVYVDCGDKARNLLVPPAHGYGFHIADAAAATARVLASVPPERVETVARLEAPRS
jgi:hypothetical protein